MDGLQVVVIGAGVAGASTAFSLARRGASVTVVDAAIVGRATAAGAGIVQPWGSSRTGAFYDLYAAGAAHYPQLLDELHEATGCLESEIGYRRCGALIVDADRAVVDDVERRVRARLATAPMIGDITAVNPVEARTLFPPLAEGLHGLHLSGGARVDGRLLCRALNDASCRLGATSLEGSASLYQHAAGVGVCVDGRRIPADAVVLAGGAWSNAVLAPIGVRVTLEPQRGQLVHLRLDGVDTSGWPSISPVADHYMVAFDDSRIVAGATRETGSGYDPRVTAAGQRHVLANALDLAPGLSDATVIETRVGLRPMAPDGQPIIGEVPGFDGLYVASGYGAVGLTIAPFVGDQLSEAILSDGTSALLAAFAPRTNELDRQE